MGLSTEKENSEGYFSLCDAHENYGMYEDRLQKLEDAVVLMKRQVDYVATQMEKLEEKVKGFQENLDGTLKELLVQERNRNNKLLVSYSKLKVKYDNLMKLWKGKKETSASDDSDIILLKQEFRGKIRNWGILKKSIRLRPLSKCSSNLMPLCAEP